MADMKLQDIPAAPQWDLVVTRADGKTFYIMLDDLRDDDAVLRIRGGVLKAITQQLGAIPVPKRTYGD